MAQIDPSRIDFSGKTSISAIEISPERIQPFDRDKNDSQWKELYIRSKPYLKPITEGLAMGGFGIIGAGAGAVGGPPGIAAGSIAGGALGYSAVETGFDYLDKVFGIQETGTPSEEFISGMETIKEGVEFATAGELIGPAAAPIAKKAVQVGSKIIPKITSKALQKQAGRELIETGTELTTEQISKNVEIADELMEKIPGLKFTRGQVTNDNQAIALERSLIRSATKIKRGRTEVSSADLNMEQRAFAEKALEDYYNRNLTSKGKIEDYKTLLFKQKEGLEGQLKLSEDAVNVEVARLSRVLDEQELSSTVLKRLKSEKSVARAESKRLYLKIPDEKLPTDDLQTDIKNLIREEDKILEPRTQKMIGLVRKITTKTTEEGERIAIDTGYQALRKLKSRVKRNAREARSGVNPALEDARQLDQLGNIIDDAMSQVELSSPEAAQAYREATEFYATQMVPRFKHGTVADVLSKGQRGEETKIAMANIAGKFWTKDGIDDFYRAVGNDAIAVDSMRDYARFNMFEKTYNSYLGKIDPKKATAWVQKNRVILKKLGLEKEFEDIAKNIQKLDIDQKSLDLFEKSLAAKVLNAHPKDAVKQAFSVSRNYRETAKELISLAKGDKTAERGIKKAISEHILKSSKVTSEGFFTDFEVSYAKLTNKMKEYMPALREIYKNEPKKLQALKDVHTGYKILNRTLKPAAKGGSDTFENISNILAASTGARAGKYYLIVSIKKALNKYTQNEINKYLLRASFDPDYAANLIGLARSNRTINKNLPNQIKRFENLMSKITPMGIKKTIFPEREEKLYEESPSS